MEWLASLRKVLLLTLTLYPAVSLNSASLSGTSYCCTGQCVMLFHLEFHLAAFFDKCFDLVIFGEKKRKITKRTSPIFKLEVSVHNSLSHSYLFIMRNGISFQESYVILSLKEKTISRDPDSETSSSYASTIHRLGSSLIFKTRWFSCGMESSCLPVMSLRGYHSGGEGWPYNLRVSVLKYSGTITRGLHQWCINSGRQCLLQCFLLKQAPFIILSSTRERQFSTANASGRWFQ